MYNHITDQAMISVYDCVSPAPSFSFHRGSRSNQLSMDIRSLSGKAITFWLQRLSLVLPGKIRNRPDKIPCHTFLFTVS